MAVAVDELEQERKRLLKNQRQQRWRNNKKKSSSSVVGGATSSPMVAPSGGDVEPSVVVDVDISDGQILRKKTLGDRVKDFLTEPTSTRKKSTGTATTSPRTSTRRGKNNLLSTVLPTVLAGLIATYSQQMLPERYRRCAPSQQEVTAIIGPIFAIIGRRVAVTGKASKDAIDLANSCIASLAYGTRAYIVYVQIKHEEREPGYEERIRREYREKLEREAREYDEYERGDYQDSRAGTPGSPGDGQRASNDVASGSDGSTGNANPEAALFADMFKRDRAGRVKLGLLGG